VPQTLASRSTPTDDFGNRKSRIFQRTCNSSNTQPILRESEWREAHIGDPEVFHRRRSRDHIVVHDKQERCRLATFAASRRADRARSGCKYSALPISRWTYTLDGRLIGTPDSRASILRPPHHGMVPLRCET